LIVLDFRQKYCPVPLVMTKLYIKQAQPNDIFELILSDPGSIVDVPSFIKKLGHSIRLLEQSGDNIYKYQIIIK